MYNREDTMVLKGNAVVGTVRGERIKRLRDKRDLTQGQLAAYAGMAQSYLSEVERTSPSNVGSDSLVAIAKVLETSVDYLVGITDDPRSPQRKPVGQLTEEEETLIRDFRAIKSEEVRRYLLFSAHTAVREGI
jgi:transcriptional regulator with XRE-family HTH domain